MKVKKILFVASECTPFFSTGGLGDVIGSLPQAIKEQYGNGADLRVVLPLYGTLPSPIRSQLELVKEFTVDLSWRKLYCGIHSLQKNGVTYYFIDNEYYFHRGALYGSYDDGERFAFFGKSVITMMEELGYYPDILHAHDWQGALPVIYLKTKYRYGDYANIKTVFTIHNIAFQGVYDPSILGDVFELPWEDATVVEYNGAINLMKGAIQVCDLLTTVSPTYAQEIKSEGYSFGLHHIIQSNSGKLIGILNGIDFQEYDPLNTPNLLPFGPEDRQGKRQNKLEFLRDAGLEANGDSPLFALISRLTDQKGIDLVLSKLSEIISSGATVVILGTGEQKYEDALRAMEPYYPGKLKVYLAFDKQLAKRIYACADFFLMPSRTEPCGLAQMIAMRYGTLPIVRETGGLYDSVRDIGWPDGGCGFTFRNYSGDELFWSVKRAMELFSDQCRHNEVVRYTMNLDYSWSRSASTYIEEYNKLTEGK